MAGELPLLFLEGLLAFVSPCMLPMLPVYLMYLAAETEQGKRASVVNTVGFVAGFTLLFMALGATATAIGAALDAHRLLLFGAAFSLGWTPCLGPFLGSALMLAGARETVAEGVFYLFVFSMGLGLPYILAALFFTRIKGIFQWLRRHGQAIKKVSGAILAAAGIAILTDTFAYWSALFW